MNYEKQLDAAVKHADKVKQKQELYELKHSNDRPKEKLSFSKIAFIFMITNCTIIEIYALVVMFFFEDLSPLTSLIVAVVGECAAFISYEAKSAKENSAQGIVYETTMKKLEYELEQKEEDSVG